MAFAIAPFCLHLCLTLLQESLGDKIHLIKTSWENIVCMSAYNIIIIVLKLLAIGKQTTMKQVVSCWCHHNTRQLNTELPLEQTLPCADSL